MKSRARIVFGLAALAAFFLAPLAEASLTLVASPAIERPTLALVEPASEPSEFFLFEGNELTAAAAETSSAPSFHPLAAVSLFSKNGAEGPFVSVAEESYPKTRVWGLRLFSQNVYLVERELSLEVRWGCADFSCGLASGTVGWLSQDPAGDADSVNLYGFVGMRPHEKTDPLGLLGMSDVPGIAWDTFTGILDPRNAWKNTQRAAGGVVGAGKFVGKTVVGAGSLVIDVATMSVDDAAADRMVARGQGVWTAVSHPLDTVVNAHSDAFNKILEHEQKGEYFSSGAEAGELGVADAAAIYGGVQGVGALARLGRAAATRLGVAGTRGFAVGEMMPNGLLAGEGPGARFVGERLPVKPYEVGDVSDLRARSTGDLIDIHHAPQAHPAGQVIPGYDPLRGPGIALPRGEHLRIPTQKGPYTGTPRQLVAKDLRDLRNFTGAPNSALQELLDMIKAEYPGVLNK